MVFLEEVWFLECVYKVLGVDFVCVFSDIYVLCLFKVFSVLFKVVFGVF